MIPLLAAVALFTFPYIGLEVRVPLGARELNVPVADLAAALLVVFVVLARRRADAIPLPAWPGWALLTFAGLLALPHADSPPDSAWTLVRKPVFLYVAWTGAFAWVAARGVRPGTWRLLLEATMLGAASVLVASSIGRIEAGNSLWWAPIAGITNNHKTIAVALAPTVPLLLGLRPAGDRRSLVVLGIVLIAIGLSVSRTAWITVAVSMSFFLTWRGRTLASRTGLAAAIVVLGLAGAVYGPILSGSLAQMDAARSRMSLDRRAWAMLGDHPLVGWGAGGNVRYEQHTFPDYRVNGVDAHGAVQKVASEFGLLGLLGWSATTGFMFLELRRRGLQGGAVDRGLYVTFLALHVNLLFSTETFSQTHWAPLGLVWGLAHRERR